MRFAGGTKLDHANADRSVEADEHPDRLDIRLDDVEWVSPYGLVLLACLAEHASTTGLQVTATCPADTSVANYLSRMGLSETLERCGASTPLPTVNHHDRADRLHELSRYTSLDEADDLWEMVRGRIEPTLGAGRAQHFLEPLLEMTINAPEHSGTGVGFYAAQGYDLERSSSRVEFAIGDYGVGIRSSFDGTPHATDDDTDAIMRSIEKGVSRLGGTRGKGLHFSVDRVTRVGGTLAIRSGTSKVLFFPNGQQRVTPVPYVPGTIVYASVRCW